jgi:hypothetical protein
MVWALILTIVIFIGGAAIIGFGLLALLAGLSG